LEAREAAWDFAISAVSPSLQTVRTTSGCTNFKSILRNGSITSAITLDSFHLTAVRSIAAAGGIFRPFPPISKPPIASASGKRRNYIPRSKPFRGRVLGMPRRKNLPAARSKMDSVLPIGWIPPEQMGIPSRAIAARNIRKLHAGTLAERASKSPRMRRSARKRLRERVAGRRGFRRGIITSVDTRRRAVNARR